MLQKSFLVCMLAPRFRRKPETEQPDEGLPVRTFGLWSFRALSHVHQPPRQPPLTAPAHQTDTPAPGTR